MVNTSPKPKKPKASVTISIKPDEGDNFEPFSHTMEQVDTFAKHPECAPDFYNAIGRMSLQWGHVERVINVALFMTRTINSSKAHKGPAACAFQAQGPGC